jgi:cation-transporting ATPase 13A3/4/5
VATLGLFALALIWNKKLWISVRFRETKVELASHVIIVNEHDEEQLIPKLTEFDENGNLKITIKYRYLKYIYENGDFIMQRNSLKLLHHEILDMVDGIRQENFELLSSVFGQNSTRVKVDSVMKVFTEEALSSFNVYQLFACIVWYFRDYMTYAVIILVFVFFSILFEISLIRGEQKKINQMADSNRVRVYRKKFDKPTRTFSQVVEEIGSTDLVPGDIIDVNPDEKVPCDLVLLEGQCLIDESLLTGESVPMLKNALPRNDELFNEDNKEHIIFAGTYCITSVSSKNKQQPARAMVYQIGFATTKGRLIRSIMFNDPGSYRFERDANIFTVSLFSVAMLFVAIYFYLSFSQQSGDSEEDSSLWYALFIQGDRLAERRHRADDGAAGPVAFTLHRHRVRPEQAEPQKHRRAERQTDQRSRQNEGRLLRQDRHADHQRDEAGLGLLLRRTGTGKESGRDGRVPGEPQIPRTHQETRR